MTDATPSDAIPSIRATPGVVPVDPLADPWQACFTVAPLVLIGSRGDDDEYSFAPKHLAMPLGWGRSFGFVCTPRHTTFRNVVARRAFTVTFPRPDQVVLASLAAAPRGEDDIRSELRALETCAAEMVEGRFLVNGYFFLECTLRTVLDSLDHGSLVVGEVVRAHVHRDASRGDDRDDQDVVSAAPLLAYLSPGRFATISESHAFPFPAGFKR